MRIAWFNHRDPRHPQAGGAELHMMEIGRRLAERNLVDVYSERVDGQPSFEIIDGIRIHRVGGRLGLHMAALFITLSGRRRYDVFVDDVAHAVPWFSTLFSRRVVAVVHHIHGDVLFRELRFPSSIFVYLAERLIPVAYRKAPIVAVSESTRDGLTKIGARPSSIRVIHNGVEAACVERRESASPLVLYIGRLNKYKNVDKLIDEFSGVLVSIPSSKLVVAGDGPELRKLRSMVRNKGLEGRVLVLGRVSEESKVALLSSAWVNVTMSDVEGWSISCLEAAAFGTPTVACDVPGLDCSVLDGKTGLLIPLGKKGLFEAALRKVLSEPELRGRLSRGARDWSRKFSWDGAAFEFEALCQQVSAV